MKHDAADCQRGAIECLKAAQDDPSDEGARMLHVQAQVWATLAVAAATLEAAAGRTYNVTVTHGAEPLRVEDLVKTLRDAERTRA